MRKTFVVLALLLVMGVVGAIVPAQESSRRAANEPSAIAADPNASASESLADRLESVGDNDRDAAEISDSADSENAAPRELSVLSQPTRPLDQSLPSDPNRGQSSSEGSFVPNNGEQTIHSSAMQREPSRIEPSRFDQSGAAASLGDEEETEPPSNTRTRRVVEQNNAKRQPSSRRRQPGSIVSQALKSQNSSRRSVPRTSRPRSARKSQLVQSWGPSLRVETTGPREIVVGKEASYVVNVINSGRVDAKGLFLRIALPSWVQVVGNSATTGTAESKEDASGVKRLVWSVPRIAAGRDEQLRLRFVARENRPLKLTLDWVLRPIVATATIKVQKPQLRLNLTGPSDIMLGASETFALTISNPGTGPAENVVVTISTVGDAKTSRTLGTIPPQGKRKLEFDLTATDPGQMSIRAEVLGDGGLKDQLVENIQVRSPKLNVKIGGPRLKFAGTSATYEIRISNKGNATASNVMAKVHLPAGAKYTSGLTAAKATTGGVVWPVGRLESNGERVFQMKCQLLLAGENRLEVSASSGKQHRARVSFITQVEALADLKLVVNDPQGPQTVGKDVVYEMHLTNRGTKAAENIDVTVQFSKGIEPVRTEGAKSDLVPGQVLFKRIPRLGPGRKITLKIVARSSKPGNHRFRAQVECKDPDTKLASEDTTRFFGELGSRQATRKESTKKR